MAQEQLAKGIKPHQLFSLGFGTIIGVGWMLVAGNWVLDAGPVGAAIAFVLGGAVIFIIALCYAELGSLYPQSGGEVVYVYEGFGTVGAFSIGWLLTLFFVAITAFEAIATAWLIDVLIPGLDGPVLYTILGEEVHLGAVIIGLSGMLLLCWANFRGGATAARFQDILTVCFAFASLVFVVAGLAGGSVENATPLIRHQPGEWWLGGIIAVLITVPVWYSGFNTIPQALGELVDVKDSRVLVRGLSLAIICACVFYLGVIFAVAFAAPAVVLEGADLPVAAAIFSAFESTLPGKLVLVAGLLGIITSWNAMFFAAARVLFALSKARIIPTGFSYVHPVYGSPAFAVVFVGVIGGIGIFAGRGVLEPIINTIGISLSTGYLLVCLSLLKLRQRDPDLQRPYSVPLYPWLPGFAALASATILGLALFETWSSRSGPLPLEWTILLVWGIVGILCWFSARKIRTSLTEQQRREHIHIR